MANDPAVNKDAGQLEPGESNARAVRDGLVHREHGARRDVVSPAAATDTSSVVQPVNTGENIATSRPARAKMTGKPAKAAKRAR